MKTLGLLQRNSGMLFLLVAILLLGRTTGNAQSTTYSFLQNDVSARSAAMAGSFVSMRNDINAIFYNPAGLSSVTRAQASFGFFKNLLDINSGYLSYAQEVKGLGTAGLGINYVNYGTFDETDELANKTGTFSAGDLAVSVGFGTQIDENLSYGVAGKFIFSSIADARSSAIAADLGVMYFFPGANPLSLGLSLVNFGTQLDPYLNTREKLPLELKAGATVKPEHLPLLLNVDFHRLTETQPDLVSHFKAFSIGGEFLMSKELRFRFGYDNDRHRDLKLGTSAGLAGFSFGGGIVLQNFRFDYAFVSLGKIGSFNSVTLEMNL